MELIQLNRPPATNFGVEIDIKPGILLKPVSKQTQTDKQATIQSFFSVKSQKMKI